MASPEQPDTIEPDRLLWRPATDDTPSLRLFGCTCSRRVWQSLPDASRGAVEIRERFERGEASEAECEFAVNLARSTRWQIRAAYRDETEAFHRAPEAAPVWAAGAAYNACTGNWVAAAKLAARVAACLSDDYEAGYRSERLAQCELFIASGAGRDA